VAQLDAGQDVAAAVDAAMWTPAYRPAALSEDGTGGCSARSGSPEEVDI
jgi:hypothetical protein